ncbi:MAG: hypothetical protein E7773_14835 [Sphingomonas sp.]|uniref:hypothetical protein n=1 Tax=Sphingomonas sp. TaxID=28214 RepID=UPI0011F90EAF|nr:hypothetical protein [Sphingomonas sp.]THD34462.1 MAG: hypothetical protein E7773_14835 [Sphingomonas sp.]
MPAGVKASATGASKSKRKKVSAAEHEAAVADIKRHMEDYVLHPPSWRNYRSALPLKWQHVDFNRTSRALVPKKPGLYAFAVQPPHADFPPSSWLFYVGEVGATGSEKRTLWQRYKEYLNELEESIRAKVGTFIYRYRGYVRFYYCELDPAANDLKAMEMMLISALWPDGNINDFDADVARIRRAFS